MKLILTLSLIILCSTLSSAHTNRNIYKIYITSENQLLVKGKEFQFEKLKDHIKEFITNYEENPKLAEVKVLEIEHLGVTLVSKAVVSIQCERKTSYQYYLKVQNEIEQAYNEVRNEMAQQIFGKNYQRLEKKFKTAIDLKVPKRISEAEPIYIRKNGKLVRNSYFHFL